MYEEDNEEDADEEPLLPRPPWPSSRWLRRMSSSIVRRTHTASLRPRSPHSVFGSTISR